MTTTDDDGRNTLPIVRPLVLSAKKKVLVHLQSNTTKFAVREGTISRQQSLDTIVRLSLQFYRGITVGIAPYPHGNPVRQDPIPTVLP